MAAVNHRTTISLVTWNGARWLPFCLAALAASTDQDFLLLIIDNGSLDGSPRIAGDFLARHPELAAHTRLVSNRANIGFARAHNQAITWSSSEYVLVLNQDVLLSSGYLGTLAECLTHDSRAAAAMGKLRQWQQQGAEFYLGLEERGDQVIDSVGLTVSRSRQVHNLGQGQPDHEQYHEAQAVFGVPATAALYRRTALTAVSPGGEFFDEDFITYKEDIDLAWRLQRANYDSWYLPNATAYHDRSLSSVKGVAAEARQRRGRARDLKVYSWTNHLATLIKNEPGANLWRDLPWVAAHEIGKFLFLVITDPMVVILGLPRLLRLWPRLLRKRHLLATTRQRPVRELRQRWTPRRHT